MDKNAFLDWFFSEVPEMREPCEAVFQKFMISRNLGIHVIWGIGVMQCVFGLLEKPKENQALLEKVFAFFEKMADADEDTKGLLFYSTLEPLNGQKRLIPVAEALFLPKTKDMWQAYKKYIKEFQLWQLSQNQG